jgi:N4-gp56 family major capsid protein
MPPAPVVPILTQTTLPHALRTIYSAELEFTTRPSLVYDQFTEVKDDFRVKKGQQAYWTIFRQLPPALTPLVANQDIDGGQIVDFQRSLTVDEFGYAVGTTEELDLTSYFGPISDIVRSLLSPQMGLTLDLLARNAMIDQAKALYQTFASGTSLATMTSPAVVTSDLIRRAAYNLSNRRAPLMGSSYVAITHPAVIYDLRGDADWIAAQRYAGAENIFNGEEGMMHGVRFVKSENARLVNGAGTATGSTLSSAASPGDLTLNVVAGAGFATGDEVTILGSNTVGLATGTNGEEESVVVASVAGNVLNLKSALLMAHASGRAVAKALTAYPVSLLGSTPAVGKGVVLAPEVRVSLPTDKLRRMSFVGWYALLGYGLLREWVLENLWVTASQSSAPTFAP